MGMERVWEEQEYALFASVGVGHAGLAHSRVVVVRSLFETQVLRSGRCVEVSEVSLLKSSSLLSQRRAGSRKLFLDCCGRGI